MDLLFWQNTNVKQPPTQPLEGTGQGGGEKNNLDLFAGLIKKFFHKYILRRKYYRYGKCNRCGDCCSKIYVKHKSDVINNEDEFKKLQKIHPFYRALEIISKDSQGLVFKCNNFDKENHLCKIHFLRSSICRKYPSEEIFKFKGVMSEKCGYYFKPIESFNEILEKLKSK